MNFGLATLPSAVVAGKYHIEVNAIDSAGKHVVCIKGDLDKAMEVFRQMQANNMAADAIVYNTILDGCTRHNRMDLADEILEDFEQFNIKPSNFTIGILIKMYSRRKRLDKAFEVLEQLPRRHGFKPNVQVRTGLICACLSNRDLDRALQVLTDIWMEFQTLFF